MKDMSDMVEKDMITFRKPRPEDGPAVNALVDRCKPLDTNSLYCNLLQCDHFRDTCVIAEMDGDVVGWVSGYLPPAEDDSFFVWQVAVDARARGRGLGGRMLTHLMLRPESAGVTHLKTTITQSNDASWALFRGFANRKGADLSDAPHFKKNEHLDGRAATEHMVTIRFAEPLRKVA